MATTLQQVKGYLDEKGVKYHFDGGKQAIKAVFDMESYVDPEGEKALLIVVRLHENGEFIEAFAPHLYKYKDGPNVLPVLQACLVACWMTKMIQFEYDPSDGEIRATIEVPLEDSTLTSRQLDRMIRGLLQFAEKFHPMIKAAIETGKIVPPEDDDKRMDEVMEMLRRMGPEGLKKLLDVAGQTPGGTPAPASAASAGDPPAKL